MSLVTIENPLTRLSILPNGMNWRGGWSATEQYYKNDVVVSSIPNNESSYILTGATTSYGGNDPSTNPLWVELSATTTGVAEVNAGTAIEVTGTTNVTVNAVNIYSNISVTPLPNNNFTNFGTSISLPSVTDYTQITTGKIWTLPDMIDATTGVYPPTSYNISFSANGGPRDGELSYKCNLYAWDGTATPPILLDSGITTYATPYVPSLGVQRGLFAFQITLNQLISIPYDATAPLYIYLEVDALNTTITSSSVNLISSSVVTFYNYLKVVTTRLGEAIPFPPP